MLNLNCIICAELFVATDDPHVTSCGHMFHIACLRKWLERSKTCPQCRNRCTDRNIIRVYFNLANLDCSRLDVGSLQEQLDDADLQLKVKEKELKKAADEIKCCKVTQKKCMKTIAGLEKDLQSKNFLILNYVEKTKLLESQVKLMEDLRKECKDLKEQIEAMNGVNTLLTATMSEAEKILNNEKNPKILSSWVATLKRELKMCENKKSDMHSTLKSVQSNLRKEIEQRKSQDERNSQLESENYQLLEKIKCLEDIIKRNSNNKNSFESPAINSIQVISANKRYTDIAAPSITTLKEENSSHISPTTKSNIKKIEESSSPYLNIKSCNVLLQPLLMKNHENQLNNSKALGSKVTLLKVSPDKRCAGAIRKTKSDLCQQYSILKKPRFDLVSMSGSSIKTMKPLAPNHVFNGFGGSERVDPFERDFISDEEIKFVNETNMQSVVKQKSDPAATINSRLKRGGLRNIKLTK